jgi:hypothetical protein
MKIELKNKKIPRNKAGDPSFKALGSLTQISALLSDNPITQQGMAELHPVPTLLSTFHPDEIVELVNRCLYQLEYQTRAHKLRSQRERDALAPVKTAFKQMFPGVSFINATEGQIEAAMRAVKEENKESVLDDNTTGS